MKNSSQIIFTIFSIFDVPPPTFCEFVYHFIPSTYRILYAYLKYKIIKFTFIFATNVNASSTKTVK